MTPTALSGISPAAAASSQASPQQYACPFPPFDLTASTAIASVLAGGVTTGALAYMSGFDTAYAMLTGLAVFAGGMVLWVAETFSLMRQQQFLHSTMQHVVFNGAHVAVSGLLGNMPATVASTALAQQFAGPPVNISMNGNPAQESPRTELSAGGLALLLSSVAIPTYAVLFFSLRSLRAAAKRNEGHFSSASGTRAQRPLAHSVFKYLIDFGAPLIGTAAVLAAPALTLSCVVNNEAGTRYGILFAGNLAGSFLREILNQTTVRAWPSIKRDGLGIDHGLSNASAVDRPWSTIVPTTASMVLFGGSSALLLYLTDSCTQLQLVPPGMSILQLTMLDLVKRSCTRQLAIGAVGEMLEALWRYLPIGAYAAITRTPLAYRRSNGAGLLHSPRQWLRHVADTASYEKALAFTAARIVDGGLTNALYLSPYGRWGAPLIQGATMARTPLLAANVLPRLKLAREHTLSLIEAGPEEDSISIAMSTTSRDPSEHGDTESLPADLRHQTSGNTSNYVHSYF